MPASDNSETELRPLREAEIQNDKTVKRLVDGDHSSFGEAELIYQDVSAGTPKESVSYRLRTAGGKKHTTKKWKERVSGCADKGVARYIRHLRHDLNLELWDFSAPPSEPSVATDGGAPAARAVPPVHQNLAHVPIYHLAPWSLGPAGAPRPWSLGGADAPRPWSLGGANAPRPWSLGGADSPEVATPAPGAGAAETGTGASPLRLAILDTGIPCNYATLHPRLAGTVEATPDYEDPTGSDGNLRLDAGHGLFILDLVMGFRPDLAPVYMRRPLRGASNMTLGEHLVGLDLWEVTTYAVDHDIPLIVNMSFSAYAADDTPGLGLLRELAWMDHQGYDVLVVAAAGNTGDERKCFPAACGLRNVVSVGALDGKDEHGVPQVASFSSRGPWVDCWIEGVDIVAGYLSGVYNHPPKHPQTFPAENSWAQWSGTSFATPLVAVAIADKAASMPGASLLAVWEALRTENQGRHPQWSDPARGTVREKGIVI